MTLFSIDMDSRARFRQNELLREAAHEQLLRLATSATHTGQPKRPVQQPRWRRVSVGVALVLLGCSLVTAWSGFTPVAAAIENPCSSLTPAAIQQVIDTLDRAVTNAAADASAHGTSGAYASAARDSLTHVTQARDKMVALQTGLRVGGFDMPYVSNVSAAYTVHGTMRETQLALLYGQHWAMISAVYHRSAPAKQAYEAIATGMELGTRLGSQAGRCYLGPVAP